MLIQNLKFHGGLRHKQYEASAALWFYHTEDGQAEVFGTQDITVSASLCDAKHPFVAYYDLRLDQQADEIKARVDAEPLETDQLLLLLRVSGANGERVLIEQFFHTEMLASLFFVAFAEAHAQEQVRSLSENLRNFRLLETAV